MNSCKSTGGVPAYLGVGSNLSPERHVPAALREVAHAFALQAVSTVYITAPLFSPEQPPYRNAVWAVRAHGSAEEVVRSLKQIETRLGRTRMADRFAARTIDLDLLWFGEAAAPALRLPSRDIFERSFVACPLAEIEPDLLLPAPDGPGLPPTPVRVLAERLWHKQGPLVPDVPLSDTTRRLAVHLGRMDGDSAQRG